MGKEDLSLKGSLWFDGSDYFTWSLNMKAYLQALEVDVWNTVNNGYTPPKARPKCTIAKILHRCHAVARNSILNNLSDDVKAKVGPQSSAKEIWTKLQDSYSRKNIYEC